MKFTIYIIISLLTFQMCQAGDDVDVAFLKYKFLKSKIKLNNSNLNSLNDNFIKFKNDEKKINQTINKYNEDIINSSIFQSISTNENQKSNEFTNQVKALKKDREKSTEELAILLHSININNQLIDDWKSNVNDTYENIDSLETLDQIVLLKAFKIERFELPNNLNTEIQKLNNSGNSFLINNTNDTNQLQKLESVISFLLSDLVKDEDGLGINNIIISTNKKIESQDLCKRIQNNLNIDIDNSIRLSLINCFEIPEITQEKLIEMLKIFCQSFDSYFCTDLNNEQRSEESNKILDNLEQNFKKMYAYKVIQKYKFNNKYIPIVGTSSLILMNSKSDNGVIKISNNLLPPSKIALETSFENCIIKNENCFIEQRTINEINSSKLAQQITLMFNHHYKKKIIWDNCKIDNLSLIRLYYDNKDNKFILYPVNDFTCTAKKDVKSNELSFDKRAMVKIGAMNGIVLSSIIEQKIYTNSNKNNQKGHNKKLTHIENLLNLVKSVVNDDSPFKYPNVILNDNCKEYCGSNKACASTTKNLLCLGKNNDTGKEAIHDKSIIAHELAHLLIPKIIKSSFKTLASINTYQKVKTDMRLILHDMADTFSIIYSNDNICDTPNNCVGFKINIVGEAKDNVCHDKGKGHTPRAINESDAYNNNIDFINKNDYRNNEISGQMYNIALQTELKHTKIKAAAYLKHWIRFIRSIMLFNYDQTPCKNCDTDLFLAQQDLLNNYSMQFIGTPDEKRLHDIFYNWSLSGYINKSINCISKNKIFNGNCLEKNNNNDDNIMSRGLSYADLSYDESGNIIVKVNTGINFYFNSENKLVINNHKSCNKYIYIKLFNENNETETYSFNDVKFEKNNCLFITKIEKNSYFKNSDTKLNNISYIVMTQKHARSNSMSNLWYENQEHPTIKLYNNSGD